MLTERNPDTTKWPKMDITNCRSMELLKRLGVADSLRTIGKVSRECFCCILHDIAALFLHETPAASFEAL
jgi:hypothetical protein